MRANTVNIKTHSKLKNELIQRRPPVPELS